MVPTLNSGDYVLSWGSKLRQYKRGDIVVVCHPVLGNIVKRVNKVYSNKCVELVGDNVLSVPSDVIGLQEPDAVLGYVLWRSSAIKTGFL